MQLKRTEFNRGYFEVENVLNLVQEHGGFIAGGFARYCASPLEEPAKAKDIDIFTNSIEQFRILKEECLERGFLVATETSYAITYSNEGRRGGLALQIIKPQEFKTIEELLSRFDFTICQAAIDVDSKRLLFTDHFEKDELAKELIIANVDNPIQTLDRVFKYQERGYHIHPRETIKLFDRWVTLSSKEKEAAAKFAETHIKEYLPRKKSKRNFGEIRLNRAPINEINNAVDFQIGRYQTFNLNDIIGAVDREAPLVYTADEDG